MSLLFPKSLCRFLRQHRKKFIFTGVLVGGLYGVVKFLEYKIKDHFSQEQKRLSEERKLQKNFKQVKQHCMSIAEAMLVEIMDKVKQVANTEEITQKLKAGGGDKVALWQELKILVFCRIVTGVYTVVLTVLTLQIQLSQIAGLMFNSPGKDESTVDARQQKFLSVTHDHLLQHGIHDLATQIRKVSIDHTESMPLQTMCNYKQLETTLQSICSTLFQESRGIAQKTFKLINFAFPSSMNLEDWTLVPPPVQDDVEAWTAKTIDILDSPDFEKVAIRCVNRGVSFIGKELCYAMSGSPVDEADVRITEIEDTSIPLAKSLPLLNMQLNTICSTDFLLAVCGEPLLDKFSLNVYESFI